MISLSGWPSYLRSGRGPLSRYYTMYQNWQNSKGMSIGSTDMMTTCFASGLRLTQTEHSDSQHKGLQLNRTRFALSQGQVTHLVEDIAWRKDAADDGILLQHFVSNTDIDPEATRALVITLDICRVNVKFTDPAEESVVSLFGTLQFSDINTAGACLKLKSNADKVGYGLWACIANAFDIRKFVFLTGVQQSNFDNSMLSQCTDCIKLPGGVSISCCMVLHVTNLLLHSNVKQRAEHVALPWCQHPYC